MATELEIYRSAILSLLDAHPAPWKIVEGGRTLRDANGGYIACHDQYGGGGWLSGHELVSFANRIGAAIPRCEKCRSPKTRKVVAITEPNLPWHDGRSEREICSSCPAKDQLPWAQKIVDA